MNPEFLKRQGNFLILLTAFTALVYVVHWYIMFQFFSEAILILPLWAIYGFHFITILIVFSIINYKVSNGAKEVFTLFMGATLLKMVLAMIFLLPLLIGPNENVKLDVFNFFIPYFLFLAFEIMNITGFLKDQ